MKALTDDRGDGPPGSRIGALAAAIAPYRIFGGIDTHAAGDYDAAPLFSQRTRILARLFRFFD